MATKHEREMGRRGTIDESEDIAKVARIDTRLYERRKWKVCHQSARKARANASQTNTIAKGVHSRSGSSELSCKSAPQYYVVTFERALVVDVLMFIHRRLAVIE